MEAVAAAAVQVEGRDARALAGDREAFNLLYRPHFEGVYDFVLRIVGEPEPATEVVRRAFDLAWSAFPEQGNDVAAWLFTASRTGALDALRYRRDRNGADREPLHLTRLDGNRVPDAAIVFDQALAELVWEAASTLSREDYSLLALHVRHGLSADDIGEQLGLNGRVSVRLARTRDVFEEHVTFGLVAARARHTCGDLDRLVARHNEHELAKHVRRCARCRETTRAFVSPAAVLGSLALVEPPPPLGREIFKPRRRRRRLFGIL